jgi:hypothetical protein
VAFVVGMIEGIFFKNKKPAEIEKGDPVVFFKQGHLTLGFNFSKLSVFDVHALCSLILKLFDNIPSQHIP